MIQYFQKQEQSLLEVEDLSSGCWINIAPPFNYEELEYLSERLNIPLDFLTDSLDIDERSRFEIEDEVILFVLNAPLLNESEDQTASLYITVPIGIIVCPDHIVTICSYETPILRRFQHNKLRLFDPSDRSGFVLLILEQTVYYFLACLKDLNVRRNLVEQELFDSSQSKDLMQLLKIEKSLVYFATALSSNALLKVKTQRADLLRIKNDEDKSDLLDDIIIDNSQAQEMATIYTNILSSTMDTFGSIISNNLNLVIQRLTLITILLAVPTLVSSFFGMNVPLPFAHHVLAFGMVIIVALLLSLSLIFYLRRKRML